MIENQTEEKRIQFSLDIDKIINVEMKSTVKHYVDKYSKTFERKLGLTKDDLVNDIREQVWKALLTHQENREAGLKTYVTTIIKNRFLVLLDRSNLKKHNSVDYYPNTASLSDVGKEHLETEETGETILEMRQEYVKHLVTLTKLERVIYQDLVLGFTLNEMVRKNKMSLSDVITSIKKIDDSLKKIRSKNE